MGRDGVEDLEIVSLSRSGFEAIPPIANGCPSSPLENPSVAMHGPLTRSLRCENLPGGNGVPE